MENDALTFEPAVLPKEAFSYQHLMSTHGLPKAAAKKAVRRFKEERVFMSSLFQANLHSFSAPPPFGAGTWISLKRRDKAPILDRAVMGAVLRALLPGSWGFELFPANSRVVDTANQYHLWTFPHDVFLAHIGLGASKEDAVFETAELTGLPVELPLMLALRPANAKVGDWRLLQALKEERFPESEAIQVHAPMGDQHPLNGWLLVLPSPQHTWPFGWAQGMRVNAADPRLGSAQQRPFEN